MTSFLTLCADLTRESGGVGVAPTSVTGQTGRQLKCVYWVIGAWELIQNASPDWTFLRAEFSKALLIDTMTYTATAWSLTRFGEFLGDRYVQDRIYHPVTIYDTTIGQSDETALHEITYDDWRQLYDRGSHDAQRPIHFAIAPDRSLRVGPKPDKAYAIRGEYRKAPQVLATNAEEPDCPARFHKIIVWRGIMLMAEHDEAPPSVALAAGKYAEMMMAMQRDCLPAITIGAEPFA